MRKAWSLILLALASLTTVPQAVALRHDDPCGAAGDASDTWQNAAALSAAALGAG